MLIRLVHAVVVVGVLCGSSATLFAADQATVQKNLEKYLTVGDLAGAVKEFEANLAADPADDNSRYALGITRLLTAVEHLSQNLFRYGLRVSAPDLPVLRLPVPENIDPEPITYEKLRALLQQFIDDLAVTADVLSPIKDPSVKLMIPVGLVRLDVNGDGKVTKQETFWTIFRKINPGVGDLTDAQQRFDVAFDAGDVHWMIGYTHVLRAMLEAWLAQNSEKFHNILAPYVFSGAAPEESPLRASFRAGGIDTDSVADLVAAIHLMSFQLAEPERMPRVRQHLLEMVRQSRLSWELIQKETDNDHEWIPNPKQDSVVGLRVTPEQVESWQQVMNELAATLNGTRLIPHWRLKEGTGVNLKRVFDEPQGFDLIMWVHGAAALPYAEEGDVVTPRTAETLTGAFGGQFFLFAVWFN